MRTTSSRSFVSTFLLLASVVAVPAAAGPRIPSRFVPGDAAVSPAVRNQVTPFLSRGGSTVLALWSDDRANDTGAYEGETSWDIYGMRFDASGNALDALPIPIATGPASQRSPRAAWNGTNWLVVFESVDFGGTGYYQASLEALRVAPDGRVIDPKPIKIYNDTPVGSTWAVASDGAGWVVVNQGTSVTSDLVGSRISADGVLLDPGPRSLVKATYYLRGNVRLEFAGGVFLLTYEESMTGYDPTNAIRFDAGLNLLDGAPFGLAPAPLSRLASNGSGFYAVWNEQLPDYTMAVKGTRIGTSGQKLDGAGVNVSGPNPPAAYTTTSVTWDGSNWRVTWGAADATRVARVSGSGQVLDPGGVAAPGPKSGISASAGNGTVQLAWSEFANGNEDTYSAHVDSGNAAGPNRTLSAGAPTQMRVDVATNGNGFMMVYRSSSASRNRVLAQPLDANGNPTTVEPIELDAATSTSYPGSPSVAWNGSLYLAAWNNAGGVVARRVQPNGAPLDAAPTVVMNPGFGPVDVEALGGDFLVVGLRCGINCEYVNPIAARVRGADGVVLDTTPIGISGTFSSNVRVGALGGRWLVVFQDNATHDNPYATTDGVFVDAGGGKAPEFTIHGPYSSAGGNGIFGIGLASSGSVALMVQSQELTSGVETDLLGRLIDPDGTVHPAVNLTPWKDDQYRPRAAWDGAQFVVVWQDQKTALGGDWSLEQIDARSDLMGMRITPSGSIVDPQGFVVSNSPVGETYPNLAATGGRTLIAGSYVRNTSPFVSYRIGYELYGTGGNAWPVASASAAPTAGDVPLTLSFSSTGSSDPGGGAVSYAWDFGDGATSTEADPDHLYATGGPYVATLTVTDLAGAASVQTLLVNVLEPNLPPVAASSSNVSSGPAPLDVIFSASGTYDPDGFVGNLEWTFSDGGSYWGATAYHTFEQPGTYQASVTAFDGRGGTGSTAPLTITVGPPLPPAAPSSLSAIAFTPDWINLTWTDNANNEDGFKVERCQGAAAYCGATPSAWAPLATTGRNIDYYGDTGLPPTTTFSYRVRAYNVSGDSPLSNISTATTPTEPPVAVNAPSVLNGPAPLAVTFDGRGSYDPDGTIVSWSWVFGDGASQSGALANHTYAGSGYFYTTLTVTDDDGATNSAYATIHVEEGGVRSVASGDGGTPFGAIFSGTYLDTRTQDGLAEVLIESQLGGSPPTRTSALEHEWSLTVAAGATQTFYLDAWHSPNAEGDDFLFEYSRDRVSWTPMVTVSGTVDSGTLQSYGFGGDVTGTLWVRTRDLDRTAGRAQPDKVYVDEMFVSSSMSAGRCGEVGSAAAFVGQALTVSKDLYGQLSLSWGASCVATDNDYAVYQGRLGEFASHVPVLCSTGGATAATIPAAAGDVYLLVVPNDGYYEGRYGLSGSGAEIPAGPTRCYPAAATRGCP
ncbi:MAG TPA: PKD domain-containing protein [Candidatus Polarisedimenticolaceae bacterium]